jgi:hypothetical protein
MSIEYTLCSLGLRAKIFPSGMREGSFTAGPGRSVGFQPSIQRDFLTRIFCNWHLIGPQKIPPSESVVEWSVQVFSWREQAKK